jgi:hypothetical protein
MACTIVHPTTTQGQAAPPALSMLEISAQPPIELSAYDRRLLQNTCVAQVEGILADLRGDPAHTGPYDLQLQVVGIEPVVEHLDLTAGRIIAQRAVRTIQHALLFWDSPPLRMANPTLLIVPAPQVPDLEMGPFPGDPRVPVELYQKRSRRFACNVEVTFEGHGTHSKLIYLDHPQAIQFERSVQGGQDDAGRWVTRMVRHPIRWSATSIPADTMLTGVQPALEVLRLQLSAYTDREKQRLFEQYGRSEKRDREKFERPLWRLDAAEMAVARAVGRIWLDQLARDKRHQPPASQVDAMVKSDPAVSRLLQEYPHTRDGALALVRTYTADPMAMVARLGPALDR